MIYGYLRHFKVMPKVMTLSQQLKSLDWVGLNLKQRKIRTGPRSGYPVSWFSLKHGSRESATPTIQGSGDISTSVQNIPTTSFVVDSIVPVSWGSLIWVSGLIPLECLYLRPLYQHFHSLVKTNPFTPPHCSDPLVLANLLRK